MEDEIINKEFHIMIPMVKSHEDKDGNLFLKGLGSNLDLDLDEDQMQKTAIDDMKEQSTGLTGFFNHRYLIGETDFGVIKGYEDSENEFIPIFEVFEDKKEIIKNRLDKGAKIGLSIGGKIKDAVKEGTKRLIKSVQLEEVSLTYFPANQATLGTVGFSKESKCKGGICKQIFKSIEYEPELQKGRNWVVQTSVYDAALKQIKAGNYDKESSWIKPTLSQFGGDIDKFKAAHLARDSNKDEKLAGAYGYPIMNAEGKILRSGVMAANRAANGSMTGIKIQNIAVSTGNLVAAMQDYEEKLKNANTKKEEENMKNLIKAIRSQDDSYEALRDKIRVAVNQKYTIGDRTKFWVQNTYPDAVIVEAYEEDKLYEITYEIDAEGAVILGEPVEVDEQYVTKKRKEGMELWKEVFKGVDKVGENKIEIPEDVDLDESIVKKLNGLGEKSKEFIKTKILGSAEESDETKKDEKPEGGELMNKEIEEKFKKMDEKMEGFQKDLEEKDKIIKEQKDEIKKQNEEIETLKTDTTEIRKEKEEAKKDLLVKDILDSHKTLKHEDIIDETTLVKSMIASGDYEVIESKDEEGNVLKDAEDKPIMELKDLNKSLAEEQKGLKIAKKHIPDGDLPTTTDNSIHKDSDVMKERAAKARKKIEEMGTVKEES